MMMEPAGLLKYWCLSIKLWHHIPEDHNLDTYHCEDFKSHIIYACSAAILLVVLVSFKIHIFDKKTFALLSVLDLNERKMFHEDILKISLFGILVNKNNILK